MAFPFSNRPSIVEYRCRYCLEHFEEAPPADVRCLYSRTGRHEVERKER